MKTKHVALGCLLPIAIGIGLLWLAWPTLNGPFRLEPWSFRKARFERAAFRAEPLIEAIGRYSSEHGRPPQMLTDLIPRYLDKIPGTGLREYPQFEYHSFSNSRASLVWFDLGSRNGKPATGLWVYPDGNPDHAILVFTLDKDDLIVEGRVDRMPETAVTLDFDPSFWLAKSNRIEMVRSLPKHHPIERISLTELEQLLGAPDGTRVLLDSPWELRINCSWGFINWDVFFYWPATNYPAYIYGGTTERIGDWVYVHE